jgi:hypothetical protein
MAYTISIDGVNRPAGPGRRHCDRRQELVGGQPCTREARHHLGRRPYRRAQHRRFRRSCGAPGKRGARFLSPSDGDVTAALDKSAQIVEAAYAYPFLSNIDLEPQNCTAHFQDGKVVFRAPTKNPCAGAKLVATTLGIPETDITVDMARIGGGPVGACVTTARLTPTGYSNRWAPL